MSTYWYLECLDHDPPLRSDAEVEQHTRLERIIALAENREEKIAEYEADSWVFDYFECNAMRFLVQHPKCRLRFISEYGETKQLPPTRARLPQDASETPRTGERTLDTENGSEGAKWELGYEGKQ